MNEREQFEAMVTPEMAKAGAQEYAMTHQRVQTAESSATDIYLAMQALAASPVPAEIMAIADRLRTQDNRITDNPLFAVQQKREYVGSENYNDAEAKWVDEEGREADDDETSRLDAEYAQTYAEPEGWRRVHVFHVWEFVTGCLTEQGCKDYIARNGHNLREPRIYAYGSYRNAEWIALRKWLMSLPAAPTTPNGLTESETLATASVSAPAQQAEAMVPLSMLQELYRAAYWLLDGVCENHPALGEVFNADDHARLCGVLAKLDPFFEVESPEDLAKITAPAPSVEAPAQQAEAPSQRQQKLLELADRIDHEELWRRPRLEYFDWPQDKRDRVDAGVNLRRYAYLLQPGRWLVIPPTGPVQFSAKTLEAAYEMAAKHEGRAATAPSVEAQADMSSAARDVLAERRRQVEAEGWTPEHDDEHKFMEMAFAACCYCVADECDAPPAVWPWDWSWWKPSDPRRNLVKAGALILAEIERLDRKEASHG